MTVPTVSASSERDTACQSMKKNGVVSANSAKADPNPMKRVAEGHALTITRPRDATTPQRAPESSATMKYRDATARPIAAPASANRRGRGSSSATRHAQSASKPKQAPAASVRTMLP